MVRPIRLLVVGEVFLQNACAHRRSAEAGDRAQGVVGITDRELRELAHQ